MNYIKVSNKEEKYTNFILTNVVEAQTIRQNTVGISDGWYSKRMGSGINIYQFSGKLFPTQVEEFERRYKNNYRASVCISEGNDLIIGYEGRTLHGFMLSLRITYGEKGANFTFNFIVTVTDMTEPVDNIQDQKIHSYVADLGKCTITFNEKEKGEEEKNTFTGFTLTGLSKTYREKYQVAGLTMKDFRITTFGSFPEVFSYSILIPESSRVIQGKDYKMKLLEQADVIEILGRMPNEKISINYGKKIVEGYLSESVRTVDEGPAGMSVNFGLLVIKEEGMGSNA